MRLLGLPEFLFILGVGVLLLPLILYVLALQRALERCATDARTLSPGLVWLMLIPLFNLAWHFIVVINISKSLHNEFARRNIPDVPPEPGKRLGLAMCLLSVAGIIPVIRTVVTLMGLVCWFIYWVKIEGYSRMLKQTAQT